MAARYARRAGGVGDECRADEWRCVAALRDTRGGRRRAHRGCAREGWGAAARAGAAPHDAGRPVRRPGGDARGLGVNTLRIARLTFREAVRRKALYGALVLTLGFLVLYGWGTGVAVREIHEAMPRGLARVGAQTGQDLSILAVGELFLAGLFAVSNIAGLLAI